MASVVFRSKQGYLFSSDRSGDCTKRFSHVRNIRASTSKYKFVYIKELRDERVVLFMYANNSLSLVWLQTAQDKEWGRDWRRSQCNRHYFLVLYSTLSQNTFCSALFLISFTQFDPPSFIRFKKKLYPSKLIIWSALCMFKYFIRKLLGANFLVIFSELIAYDSCDSSTTNFCIVICSVTLLTTWSNLNRSDSSWKWSCHELAREKNKSEYDQNFAIITY